jgi:glycosyltransferase involved in cell wall biosynthesis
MTVRIAWLGPTPSEDGGAPYAETLWLKALAKCGVHVDCFIADDQKSIPPSLRAESNLRFFCEPLRWSWGRWYSRNPVFAFLTVQVARARAERRLIELIGRRHSDDPYDVLYQFSQIEWFGGRRRMSDLPPLVIHPGVHAAGELAWYRRESHLARSCESSIKRLVVRAALAFRVRRQRRDVALARLIISPSRRFADWLSYDYGVRRDRIRVIPHPADFDRFWPDSDSHQGSNLLTLLFVSRISVRKGVEMIVDLSHRLSDLKGRVRILVIGDHTLWSDYRPLLSRLNREIATYAGPVPPTKLPELYRAADAILQPSRYEPFALTVVEALASGVAVVASSEVGATEDVDPACCTIFPSGDINALESAIRGLLGRRSEENSAAVRKLARSEAERLFAPHRVAAKLIDHLEDLTLTAERLPAGLTGT